MPESLPQPQAAQLAAVLSQYQQARKAATSMGIERSFCEAVYADITNYGKTKDTFAGATKTELLV